VVKAPLWGTARLRGRAGRRDYADAVNLPRKRAVLPPAPAAVRVAGWIVAVQGVAALVVAAVLVVRGIAGADQHVVNGLGTAVWFILVGGVVLAAGRALVVGKRWGRGLAVFTQLLLLPVAWYLAVGSHQPAFGIPAGMVALTTLILLFSPAAVRWAAGGDQRGPASSASGKPDSR
jgi:peptidoglycan/LPS O-acetylase OafA/YrhL